MTAAELLLLDSALAAAAEHVGTTLTREGGLLPAADRAVVIRARRSDTRQTVIVKAYNPRPAGEGWAREAAALTALVGLGTSAPELIAVIASPPVVVMEDLGTGDSLATALLGADPEAAGQAAVEWAESLADLHAATWNNVTPFETALSTMAGTDPIDSNNVPNVLADGVERLRRAANTVDVELSDQVGREIVHLAEVLDDGVRVVSPFDACPDNNVRTAAGLRLIDFEGATVAHPAWDVAYLSVPWPSCWCAWRLPDAITARAQQAWVERLITRLAARGLTLDRPAMDVAIRLASLTWCVVTVGWFLPGAQADRHPGGQGISSPRLRAVVQHRLAQVASSSTPELNATRELARRLSAALNRNWQPETLQLAPAFRRG